MPTSRGLGLKVPDIFRTLYVMAKTSRLDLRLSEEERDLYERAAEADSRTLSNWIRDRLNKAAKAELGEAARYQTAGQAEE
jgi:uncharacterized protein (DUF1778 family)